MSLVRVGARSVAGAAAPPAHMLRYGAGPRVFAALHGWTGTARSFEPLVPFMPRDVSMFSVDQPGFGRTPRPPRWTMAELVAPVTAAIERLPSEPITLVGNCAGAIVALHAALRLGPRVERVVLIDPFSHAPWYFSVFDWPLVGGLLYLFTFANPFGRALTNRGLSDVRKAETDLIEGFRTVRHGDAWRYLRLLVRSAREGIAGFGGYAGRVDILFGERTFPAVRRSVDDWRGLWPHLVAHEIPGAGHLPVHEAPHDMARLIFSEPRRLSPGG